MSDTNLISGLPVQSLVMSGRLEGIRESSGAGKVPDEGKNPARLKQALCELESLFISYLFKEMRATVPRSGFINGGKAEELYTSMLDNQLAMELSRKGGIGLSGMLADRFAAESEKGAKEKFSSGEENG